MISLCRSPAPLPEIISHDLLVVQMICLENRLKEANPIFETDLILSIMNRLAEIYTEVNRFNDCQRTIVESSIFPEIPLKGWERWGR